MIKEFFLFLLFGLIFLALQSTWFAPDFLDPLRLDMVFVLVIFLGTLTRIGRGLSLSILLGLFVDVLSWGMPGAAMILYPLFFWIFYFLASHTDIHSLGFVIIAVLVFQIFYGFGIHFFLALFKGLEFNRNQVLLIFEQAVLTMLTGLPVLFLFKRLFHKKPSLM